MADFCLRTIKHGVARSLRELSGLPLSQLTPGNKSQRSRILINLCSHDESQLNLKLLFSFGFLLL